MILDNIEFDGATIGIADVGDVDGKYFISVLDTIRYLGFDIGSSEYARINNRKTTGFEYLQVKFEGNKRKTNIISVEDMKTYIFDMQTRDIPNPPEGFSVKSTKLRTEFNNIISFIRKTFGVDESEESPGEEDNIEKLEQEMEESQGTVVESNLLTESSEEENSEQQEIAEVEEEPEEEDEDLSLVEINVRNTTINVAKFLIIYKQLDSYGKRHLFELLEENDREVIHRILDDEYFDIGEKMIGKEYSHRS